MIKSTLVRVGFFFVFGLTSLLWSYEPDSFIESIAPTQKKGCFASIRIKKFYEHIQDNTDNFGSCAQAKPLAKTLGETYEIIDDDGVATLAIIYRYMTQEVSKDNLKDGIENWEVFQPVFVRLMSHTADCMQGKRAEDLKLTISVPKMLEKVKRFKDQTPTYGELNETIGKWLQANAPYFHYHGYKIDMCGRKHQARTWGLIKNESSPFSPLSCRSLDLEGDSLESRSSCYFHGNLLEMLEWFQQSTAFQQDEWL